MADKDPTLFERVASGCARFTGRPAMLLLALGLGAVGVSAFLSGDDHFLNGANIAISIMTLLLLPILQATQNRDGAALQAKIDELIRTSGARNELMGLERKGEAEIEDKRPELPSSAE